VARLAGNSIRGGLMRASAWKACDYAHGTNGMKPCELRVDTSIECTHSFATHKPNCAKLRAIFFALVRLSCHPNAIGRTKAADRFHSMSCRDQCASSSAACA